VPGKGVVFLGPIKGAKAQQAATTAGLKKTPDLAALRVDGPNRPGECQRLTKLLADAGINMRGLAATVIGNKFTISLGFDSDADATKAVQVLKEAGSKTK
jgi:predicted amino acid-binding ACT domain protein